MRTRNRGPAPSPAEPPPTTAPTGGGTPEAAPAVLTCHRCNTGLTGGGLVVSARPLPIPATATPATDPASSAVRVHLCPACAQEVMASLFGPLDAPPRLAETP